MGFHSGEGNGLAGELIEDGVVVSAGCGVLIVTVFVHNVSSMRADFHVAC